MNYTSSHNQTLADLPFVPGFAGASVISKARHQAAYETGISGRSLIQLMADTIDDKQLRTATALLHEAPPRMIGRWGEEPETALFVDTASRVFAQLSSNSGSLTQLMCKRLGVPPEAAMTRLKDMAIRTVAKLLLEATCMVQWQVRPPVHECLEFPSLGVRVTPVKQVPGLLTLCIYKSKLVGQFEPFAEKAINVNVRPLVEPSLPRWLAHDPDLARAAPYPVAKWRENTRRSLLTKASAVLQKAVPRVARSPLLRMVVPLHQTPQLDGPSGAPKAARMRPESLSLENVPGLLYASELRDARLFAEVLVHEVTHQELFLLERLIGPMWLEADRAATYSSWKDDPRSPRATLHGICSFLAIANFWSRWLPSSTVASIRFSRALAQVELALNALRYQKGAAVTQLLLERLAQRTQLLSNCLVRRTRWVRAVVSECVEHASQRDVSSRGMFIDRILNGG